MTCGNIIPQPGTESSPLQWGHQVLTTGLPRNSLTIIFFIFFNLLAMLTACGILVPPTRNGAPCPLHWQHRVLTTQLPGKSHVSIFMILVFPYLHVEDGFLLWSFLPPPPEGDSVVPFSCPLWSLVPSLMSSQIAATFPEFKCSLYAPLLWGPLLFVDLPLQPSAPGLLLILLSVIWGLRGGSCLLGLCTIILWLLRLLSLLHKSWRRENAGSCWAFTQWPCAIIQTHPKDSINHWCLQVGTPTMNTGRDLPEAKTESRCCYEKKWGIRAYHPVNYTSV